MVSGLSMITLNNVTNKQLIKDRIMFNSRIVLNRIDFERKCLFRKLEQNLRYL